MKANRPTEAEIVAAREALDSVLNGCRTPAVMKCWNGVGWHKDEIWIGILIGLEIARKREEERSK